MIPTIWLPIYSGFLLVSHLCTDTRTTYLCIIKGLHVVEQELLPFGVPEFIPVFSVTRSLVLYVCFVNRCLSFCTFSFGHCVVCSSIYGFWFPLWYLLTLQVTVYHGNPDQKHRYGISYQRRDMHAPYARPTGMLIYVNGKFTMKQLKSFFLWYFSMNQRSLSNSRYMSLLYLWYMYLSFQVQ